jgi:hypothetical protein
MTADGAYRRVALIYVRATKHAYGIRLFRFSVANNILKYNLEFIVSSTSIIGPKTDFITSEEYSKQMIILVNTNLHLFESVLTFGAQRGIWLPYMNLN